MARSSQGPRRATTWAAEQHSRPMPRIVRLGRPANDNHLPLVARAKAATAAAAALVILALLGWDLI